MLKHLAKIFGIYNRQGQRPDTLPNPTSSKERIVLYIRDAEDTVIISGMDFTAAWDIKTNLN